MTADILRNQQFFFYGHTRKVSLISHNNFIILSVGLIIRITITAASLDIENIFNSNFSTQVIEFTRHKTCFNLKVDQSLRFDLGDEKPEDFQIEDAN